MIVGSVVILVFDGLFMFGWMVFILGCVWLRRNNVFWCLLVLMNGVVRRLLVLLMVIVKVFKVGVNCCLICNVGGLFMCLILLLVMVFWGFGMFCARSLGLPKSSAVGFIKWVMC